MSQKEWGDTSSQRNKKARALGVCQLKKAFSSPEEARAFARGQSRRELRHGMVHQFNVYECTVSDPTHWHLTTRGSIEEVGYRGTLNARGWAQELGCKWTDEDEAEYQQTVREWEEQASAATKAIQARYSSRRNNRGRS